MIHLKDNYNNSYLCYLSLYANFVLGLKSINVANFIGVICNFPRKLRIDVEFSIEIFNKHELKLL